MPFSNVPLATLELKYHTDPGHGWIEVKCKVLSALNIVDKISIFSYRKGDIAYLEEDCDAGVLLDALKEKNIEYNITRIHNENTPIRAYPRFKP